MFFAKTEYVLTYLTRSVEAAKRGKGRKEEGIVAPVSLSPYPVVIDAVSHWDFP